MKACVIGAGRMGSTHLRVLRKMGIEIAGVSDQRPESLEVAAKEFGLKRNQLFQDPATLLTKERPQLVVVATTTPTHAPLACLAAKSGAELVLCEKPMARSITECDAIMDTMRETGARLAVNHQMRFMEQYTRVKQFTEAPEFGGLRSISVVAGNFGLAMNGSHYFEMFRFMTGERPDQVWAWFSPDAVPNPRGPEFEDRAGSIRATNKAGARLYMEIGADQGHGIRVVYGGRNGMVTVDELRGTAHVSWRTAADRGLPTTRYGTRGEEHSFTFTPPDNLGPSQSVLAALLENRNPPSGEDGRAVVRCLVASYVSAENDGAPVRVEDSNLPADRAFPWA